MICLQMSINLGMQLGNQLIRFYFVKVVGIKFALEKIDYYLKFKRIKNFVLKFYLFYLI